MSEQEGWLCLLLLSYQLFFLAFAPARGASSGCRERSDLHFFSRRYVLARLCSAPSGTLADSCCASYTQTSFLCALSASSSLLRFRAFGALDTSAAACFSRRRGRSQPSRAHSRGRPSLLSAHDPLRLLSASLGTSSDSPTSEPAAFSPLLLPLLEHHAALLLDMAPRGTLAGAIVSADLARSTPQTPNVVNRAALKRWKDDILAQLHNDWEDAILGEPSYGLALDRKANFLAGLHWFVQAMLRKEITEAHELVRAFFQLARRNLPLIDARPFARSRPSASCASGSGVRRTHRRTTRWASSRRNGQLWQSASGESSSRRRRCVQSPPSLLSRSLS